MRKRALVATPLLFLLPFAMSGCMLFDSRGGSPTDPSKDDEKGPDDRPDDGVTLLIPTTERAPLAGLVHFV